ncbi:MAG: hypothetical protein JNL65_06065 [Saprospiraceae bacterium]|nr:hypothetical protein [Saprospiraceae bacterium]HRG69290.1 DUF6132 family protein [Saprospiraceae bacterium]
MSFILKHKLSLTGIALGALAGYLYYHFIGCASGSCIITSRPLNSSLYGAVVGWLLISMFQSKKTIK